MRMLSPLMAAALCAAGLSTLPAQAGDPSPLGSWQLKSGDSRFEVIACGDGTELCARLVWLSEEARTAETLPYLGTFVVEGARPVAQNVWRGTVHYEGETVSGRMTLLDHDTIRLNGCKGFLCRSMELVRV